MRGYWVELLVVLVIGATIWVTTLHDVPNGSFQSLQLSYYALFMLIGVVVMFNSKQTRVATERLVDKAEVVEDAGKR